MGARAFFHTARSAELDLIALELAKYYSINPELMLRKPIDELLWLQDRTFALEEKMAEHRRRIADGR